jgi:adenine-specific DNA-methyltransferase
MNIPESLFDRVVCGDSVAVMSQLPDGSADLIATDFPYLVGYRPRDGRTIAGDRDNAWLNPACSEMYRVLKPNSFCVAFYGWPQVDLFMVAWKHAGFRPVSHFAFVKKYRSRRGYTLSFHESAYLLVKGKPPRPQYPPADVLPWRYTGNRFHPNEKPVELMEMLIRPYSRRGDIVLDPFAGSGSTAVAARNCGRHFVAIEKLTRYCNLARSRLEERLLVNTSGPTLQSNRRTYGSV